MVTNKRTVRQMVIDRSLWKVAIPDVSHVYSLPEGSHTSPGKHQQPYPERSQKRTPGHVFKGRGMVSQTTCFLLSTILSLSNESHEEAFY